MRAEDFRQKVLPQIIRRFNYKDGLLLIGKTADRSPVLRLCVTTTDNPGYPWSPTMCYVWIRDSLAYEGPLSNAAKISRLFNKCDVCHILFTTVIRIETTSKGDMYNVCSDETYATCRRKCPVKKAIEKARKKELEAAAAKAAEASEHEEHTEDSVLILGNDMF